MGRRRLSCANAIGTMTMKRMVFMLMGFLFAHAAFGQTGNDPTDPSVNPLLTADERLSRWIDAAVEPPALVVRPGDPHYEVLARHQEQIRSQCGKDKLILLSFRSWVRVESAALSQLFPKLAFYSITWSQSLRPDAPTRHVSLALGLKATVGIDRDTGEVEAELYCHTGCDAFGQLLVKHKTVLQNDADAIRIWKAFCELHHTHWPGPLAQRISETEWRLPISRHDRTVSSTDKTKTVETWTSYMQTMVDAESKEILSCEQKVDTSYERTPPVDAGIEVYAQRSVSWWSIAWWPEFWFALALGFVLLAIAMRRLRIPKNAR